MGDIINSLISAANWLLTFFVHYPEFFIIPLGLIIAIAAAQGAQIVWFPDSWGNREDMRAMSLIDIVLTFLFCTLLWDAMDHDHDSMTLVHTVSAGAAVSSTAIHVVGLRVVTHKWPWVDSP